MRFVRRWSHRAACARDRAAAYEVRFTRSAHRILTDGLTEEVAAAAFEFMYTTLAANPRRLGKQLDPPMFPLYSSRRGEYRVIYSIIDAVLDDNCTQSTLDLFGNGIVAMTGSSDTAARLRLELAQLDDLPVSVHCVTHDGWPNCYGVESNGAVLIRPDGYVAWRCAASPTPGATATALQRLSGH
jgi:mRNA interferase RelE/StbE